MAVFYQPIARGLHILAAALFRLQLASVSLAAEEISAEEATTIAREAYIYLYPLITMDVTRRQLTNIEPGKMTGCGPMNTFSHMRAYPTAEFRAPARGPRRSRTGSPRRPRVRSG